MMMMTTSRPLISCFKELCYNRSEMKICSCSPPPPPHPPADLDQHWREVEKCFLSFLLLWLFISEFSSVFVSCRNLNAPQTPSCFLIGGQISICSKTLTDMVNMKIFFQEFRCLSRSADQSELAVCLWNRKWLERRSKTGSCASFRKRKPYTVTGDVASLHADWRRKSSHDPSHVTWLGLVSGL